MVWPKVIAWFSSALFWQHRHLGNDHNAVWHLLRRAAPCQLPNAFWILGGIRAVSSRKWHRCAGLDNMERWKCLSVCVMRWPRQTSVFCPEHGTFAGSCRSCGDGQSRHHHLQRRAVLRRRRCDTGRWLALDTTAREELVFTW